MKKGIRTFLVSAGLAGVLALTGCQNPTYWSVEGQRGFPKYSNPSEIYRVEKEHKFQKSEFKRYNQNQISVPVIENRTDYIQDIKVTTTPIQTEHWTAQQRPTGEDIFLPYTFFSIGLMGTIPLYDIIQASCENKEKTILYEFSKNSKFQTRIPGTERITQRTKTSEATDRQVIRKYTQKTESPAINVLVNVEGKKLLVGGLREKGEKRTDSNGKINVTFSPLEGYLNQEEAKEFSVNILKETYQPTVLNSLTNGLSFVETKRTDLTLSTKDDELKTPIQFYVPVDNLPQINSRIRKSLDEYLTKKFPLKEVEIEVRQKDSRIYLNGILMESKQLAGPTKEKVSLEQEIFLANFLRHKSDYPDCSVDSSNYLSFIPSGLTFNTKTKIRINQGAKYNVTFIHQSHYAAEKEIDFEKIKGDFFPVEMARLPAAVIQSEAKEGYDKSIIRTSE